MYIRFNVTIFNFCMQWNIEKRIMILWALNRIIILRLCNRSLNNVCGWASDVKRKKHIFQTTNCILLFINGAYISRFDQPWKESHYVSPWSLNVINLKKAFTLKLRHFLWISILKELNLNWNLLCHLISHNNW